MRKALVNQLRIDQLERCSPLEKGEIIRKLIDRYGYTQRGLAKELGIPHSTIHDWVSDRQSNVPGKFHISIDKMIEHFEIYKPRLDEYRKIEHLIKILERLTIIR